MAGATTKLKSVLNSASALHLTLGCARALRCALGAALLCAAAAIDAPIANADSQVQGSYARAPVTATAQVRFKIIIPETLSLDVRGAHLPPDVASARKRINSQVRCAGTAHLICTAAMP